MDNLKLYNLVKEVPQIAQKPISGGRLKGMTDINPMWRIQELTNQFGPCGIGWWYVITKQWLERTESGEIAAFCDIDLFVELNGMTSMAIPGTGGSMFVTKESSGLHTSDECYKMALTDALSVACKALGFGADIYWSAGTKYTNESIDQEPSKPDVKVTAIPIPLGDKVTPQVELITGYKTNAQPATQTLPEAKSTPVEVKPEEEKPTGYICESCTKPVTDVKAKDGKTYTAHAIAMKSQKEYGCILCFDCAVKAKKSADAVAKEMAKTEPVQTK